MAEYCRYRCENTQTRIHTLHISDQKTPKPKAGITASFYVQSLPIIVLNTLLQSQLLKRIIFKMFKDAVKCQQDYGAVLYNEA